ncbi:MAG: toxin-antitoxin (TA) system antitoxin [Anaerolineae bacterium]|nr:toxin-antitoxin (TA) system antitoxin [Anaerolineae bacterium]
MLYTQISIQKRDINLDELLALTKRGTEVLIMEGEDLVAKLTPVETTIIASPIKTRTPDLHPGLWMSDDFDAPLPDEFWLGEDK